MDDKHLDTLFREKLSNHEIKPSPRAWFKLEQQLAENKKPLWLIWGQYAAGFLLLLGIGIGYQYWNQTPSELGKELITEIAQIQPTAPAPMDTVTVEKASEAPPLFQPALIKPAPSKPAPAYKPSEQVATLPSDPSERLVESLPPADQREVVWTETLAFDLATMPLDIDEIITEIAPQEKEIAYTVKIVSRGYAIAPDKGQLVDGIENKLEKIGGFFTKVDKGFGDLQDAKNDLFVHVMASKKEK
ncbi:hypothetical protein [Lunatibacter salilacus]|uniref:hypothetical protein n=1 Tax=Lunatibacter salilacus TaxID=2483804 RepID=UPI00131E2E24|nr:hypothetical protein [Lunatibacter salilacus]